ncbi:MAG: hypothetical protein ACKVQT_18680 [Burkholderiales bacterium]
MSDPTLEPENILDRMTAAAVVLWGADRARELEPMLRLSAQALSRIDAYMLSAADDPDEAPNGRSS